MCDTADPEGFSRPASQQEVRDALADFFISGEINELIRRVNKKHGWSAKISGRPFGKRQPYPEPLDWIDDVIQTYLEGKMKWHPSERSLLAELDEAIRGRVSKAWSGGRKIPETGEPPSGEARQKYLEEKALEKKSFQDRGKSTHSSIDTVLDEETEEEIEDQPLDDLDSIPCGQETLATIHHDPVLRQNITNLVGDDEPVLLRIVEYRLDNEPKYNPKSDKYLWEPREIRRDLSLSKKDIENATKVLRKKLKSMRNIRKEP